MPHHGEECTGLLHMYANFLSLSCLGEQIVWNIICDCQKFCSAPTFVRSSPMSIPSSKVLFLPVLPRQNSVLVVYDFRAKKGDLHIYVIHQVCMISSCTYVHIDGLSQEGLVNIRIYKLVSFFMLQTSC